MPHRRKCPVCHTGIVIRPDVRTCGHECAAAWIKMSASEKRQRLNENFEADVLTAEELKKWVEGEKADEAVVKEILGGKKDESA